MRRFRPPWRALQGATVHATARIHPSAMLLPGAVVAARAYVGAGCVLGPNAAVGSGVTVGAGTSIGPNASLQHCTIGARCTLHAGVNIGADGFGFIPGQPAAAGASAAHVVGPAGDGAAAASADRLGAVMPGDVPPVKKAQLRRVLIGDDVEIGAGSCIDRGSWRDTVVGHHSKLDNLVQVGHNVHIGVGVLLCAQVALGGSSSIGDFCVLGGRAAVADHVALASNTRVAACAGVTTHVPTPGTTVGGFPATPARQWRREVAWLRRAVAAGERLGRPRQVCSLRGIVGGAREEHDPAGA